jgi:hypothetical protein
LVTTGGGGGCWAQAATMSNAQITKKRFNLFLPQLNGKVYKELADRARCKSMLTAEAKLSAACSGKVNLSAEVCCAVICMPA